MSRKSRRAARRRKPVDRSERVKPSALAEAKKRPWIMQQLLQRGPDNDGTTAEQHEAAIEIVDGFTALTRIVSMRGASPDRGLIGTDATHADFGPRALRLVSIYLRWATELLQRHHLRGFVVVEWINMERALGCSHIPLLVRALDLWTRHRDEWRPPEVPETPPELTAPGVGVLTARVDLGLRPTQTMMVPPPSPRVAPTQAAPRHAAAPANAPRAMAQAPRSVRGRA
jgi:hypothetical protein